MTVRPPGAGGDHPPGDSIAVPGSDSGAPKPLPRKVYLVFVVRGAIGLGLGVTVLVEGSTLSRLTTFIAVYWIVAAAFTLRWVAAQPALSHRGLSFFAGVLGLAVGVAVVARGLFQHLLSDGAFLDFLGVSAIVIGVLRFLGAIHDDQLQRARPRRRYRYVVGTFELLLGLGLLTADKGATLELRVATGVWGLAMGTFLLLDGLMARRLSQGADRGAT